MRVYNLLAALYLYDKSYNQADRSRILSAAYRDLAWAYIFNKNPKKAEESARIVLDLKKDNPVLWNLLFSLLTQNNNP